MGALRVNTKYCESCGRQFLTSYKDWREEKPENKYCSSAECQVLAKQEIYDPKTKDGRLTWATPPVYDPWKEAARELARQEKRLALVTKETIQ